MYSVSTAFSTHQEALRTLTEEYEFIHSYDPLKTYDEYTDELGYKHVPIRISYRLKELSTDCEYIAYIIELTDKQVDELLPYCQCEYHKRSPWNPARIFVCQCCVGCVTGDSPKSSIVRDAISKKYKMGSVDSVDFLKSKL